MPIPNGMTRREVEDARENLFGVLRGAIHEWKRSSGEEADASIIARPFEKALEALEEMMEPR